MDMAYYDKEILDFSFLIINTLTKIYVYAILNIDNNQCEACASSALDI